MSFIINISSFGGFVFSWVFQCSWLSRGKGFLVSCPCYTFQGDFRLRTHCNRLYLLFSLSSPGTAWCSYWNRNRSRPRKTSQCCRALSCKQIILQAKHSNRLNAPLQRIMSLIPHSSRVQSYYCCQEADSMLMTSPCFGSFLQFFQYNLHSIAYWQITPQMISWYSFLPLKTWETWRSSAHLLKWHRKDYTFFGPSSPPYFLSKVWRKCCSWQ